MLIGELSEKTGLSRDTIRFYEKKGLISVGRKERRFNNYKEYSEETLRRLMSIKLIKGFGFTLNEVSDLLDLIDMDEATCNNVADKVERKVKLLDDKINELIKIKTLLTYSLKNCKDASCNLLTPEENCPIIVTGMVADS